MHRLGLAVLVFGLWAAPAGAQTYDTSGRLKTACEVTNVSIPVTGTFWQATQPISGTITCNAGTGSFTVTGTIAATQSGGWTVTSNQGGTWNVNAAQDGSWTVTANAGSGTFGVDMTDKDARIVGRVKIHDGTDVALVTAGGALLVDASATTQPVSGTVSAAQSGAWTVSANAGSGTFTISGTVTAIGAAADGAAVSGNPVRIGGKDGSGNTQDVATDTSGELQVDVLTLPNVTIGTFPDNEPFNVAQFGGSAVATGTGTGGAGIPRVTISSDSSLAANQSANVAQFGGTNISTGTGVGGAGIPRVTISSDSSLAANQSTNLAQVAGATTQTGNGTASGSVRVSVASDSTGTTIATQSTASSLNVRQDTSGATGAAPPARADYVGGVTSGATGGFVTGIPICTEFVVVNVSSATTTALITGVSGRHVYICSINLVTAAANNVALISGTGATCGTSTTGLNGGTTGASGWNLAANGGLAQGSGVGAIMSTLVSGGATGDSVCIVTTASTQLSGAIGYAIF